ncbi:transcriptional regulator [Streptomyces sp. OE57]|uniref:transcriptional regulator n=1 Tax=Streptomyces lacaronensis TaxID=3379885 RepID=UPI0039B791B9
MAEAGVLDQLGCPDGAAFLRQVAARHASLGFGAMATRPEKYYRWCSGVRPERKAETAMIHMLEVPLWRARELGWPHWLRLALTDDDRALTAAPWTPAGSLQAMDHLEELDHHGRLADMERRAFMMISSSALTATLTNWAAASPAQAIRSAEQYPRIGDSTTDLIDGRLDHLRRLDDRIGSAQAYRLASAERSMIRDALKDASHAESTKRRLFAVAAEASRICGWSAFDSGRADIAELHYTAALHCATSASDPVVAANTLNFWAMLRYSKGDTAGALDIVDQALRTAQQTGSPRLTAMLHARAGRAHAKAGDERSSRRAEDTAFATYSHADRTDADPPCVYWVDATELHSWAATNALDLNAPRRALTHHAAIAAAQQQDQRYDSTAYPRSAALRLTRKADAHLAMSDVDAAVLTAEQALHRMGGVTSSRGSSMLADLRTKLGSYQRVPAVADFLERTV